MLLKCESKVFICDNSEQIDAGIQPETEADVFPNTSNFPPYS